MSSFIIEGKHRLHGEIQVGGNKNAALPMIAAALLTDEPVIIHNVPHIRDVEAMLDLAVTVGADVSFTANTATIRARRFRTTLLPQQLCSRLRTSLLLAAPLLVRCGQVELWPPGGDVIGRRRLDGHFYGLKSLGAVIAADGLPFRMTADGRLRGADLFLDEAGVTATEQLMIAAVTAAGITIIRNAASEPHVANLAELLLRMGADISGIGSNTLTSRGVDRLHGAECRIMGDHIEAGSYLALAAATGSELTVRGIEPQHFRMTRRIFERLGLSLIIEADRIVIPGGQHPIVGKDFGNAI
ncbi:MAG: UDP-N-acetylglucosamine 1-carboxyvinyltransferase, partial [Victivallales bacterium]|nr:UDP-N-acetylglucosamine 1-carboxyvinyltransferase [Victivallales bacterium]